MFILFVSTCLKAQVKQIVPSKLVVSDLIKTRVMLIDTTTPATITSQFGNDKLSMHDYLNSTAISYLEKTKYNQLLSKIISLVKSKNVIITNWNCGGIKLTTKEIKNCYTFCDTVEIEEFDKNGNGYLSKVYSCDSTSIFNRIVAIDFYEKWLFNDKNGMFEKEIVAYSPIILNQGKEFFKTWLTIHKNEKYIKEIYLNQ